MTDRNKHIVLNFLIATVWLANGLFCKVLNLVPRHEQIVARILGSDFSRTLTILIGLSEMVMAIWVLTKFKSKLNAITQMTVVAMMNILEFILAPDLLLWGRFNAFFALLFIGLVYYNEFVLNKHLNQKTDK
ncbi:MAG: DoxX-like family protein [Chitinophagales bacterium]|nr:DoxX-like family protein [Chitinophagales bacterium]MDW8272941.1 DoxX-like family protein [Chitinophagales bacterium]